MKKQIVNWIVIILIIFMASSCKEQKIKYFKISLEFDGPITELKENDPLPFSITTFLNYIDTNCTENLYVPSATFIRNDFDPPKTLDFEFPLSGVNRFRKSLDLLSSINLKEEYDENLNKLNTPRILVEPNSMARSKIITEKHKKDVFTLNIYESNKDSLSLLLHRISSEICKDGESRITVRVLTTGNDSLNTPKSDIKGLIYKADILYKKELLRDALKIYIIVLKSDPKNEYANKQVTIIKEKLRRPPPPPPPPIDNLTLAYAYYKGETKNRMMHGQGTLFFKERHIISPKDPKQRYAEVGDYVSGTWFEGNIVNGKLFDKNGQQKETLIIGH
jgi:hypothetical protein